MLVFFFGGGKMFWFCFGITVSPFLVTGMFIRNLAHTCSPNCKIGFEWWNLTSLTWTSFFWGKNFLLTTNQIEIFRCAILILSINNEHLSLGCLRYTLSITSVGSPRNFNGFTVRFFSLRNFQDLGQHGVLGWPADDSQGGGIFTCFHGSKVGPYDEL